MLIIISVNKINILIYASYGPSTALGVNDTIVQKLHKR